MAQSNPTPPTPGQQHLRQTLGETWRIIRRRPLQLFMIGVVLLNSAAADTGQGAAAVADEAKALALHAPADISLASPPNVAATSPASDVNHDGVTSIVDIQLAATCWDKALTDPGCDPAYDLNGDQAIDEKDLALIAEGWKRDLVTIVRTSPANGEGEVAVTRETIIKFSRPFDPAGLTATAIFAQFGGKILETRLHLSPDGKTVTLFYKDSLPASARVRVMVNGEALKDPDGKAVDADGDGQPGGVAHIDFDTLSLTVTLPGTAVCGRVFASELAPNHNGTVSVNNPLEGATITVDGMEDKLRAVTDQNGNFCLESAPVGHFFVHVDGRTAKNNVPPGAYYPFVGKAWESAPGQTTNVGNIYLPLVPADALKPVSPTEDTVITFPPSVLAAHPEFAGVQITVPANSLYADDGKRGGSVGIAPVPPDRLPGQLPPDLRFPIVITVQTDGATNFDRPVPACFPNLPDRNTGLPLPPGSKSALWSFNHDTGRFEIVGPMRVSTDGRLVCTDPGVGIPAPGWHGTQPGSPLGPVPQPLQPSCEVKVETCAPAALLGGMECLLSFIPIVGQATQAVSCTFSASRAVLSGIRDCAIGDGVDCIIAISADVGSTVASCSRAIAKAIPVLGSVITCGGAVASIVKNCTCLGRNASKSGFNLKSTRDPLTNFEAHLAVLRAYYEYYEVLFGSSVWLNIDLKSGDPRLKAEQVQVIIHEVTTAMSVNSDGAQIITETETALIRSLLRPPEITENDVNNLIDYLNRTTQLWRQGVLTHAQAGRNDFIDYKQLMVAVGQIELAIGQLEATGAGEINFSKTFDDLNGTIVDRWANPSQTSFESSRLFYILKDETNNIVQRGRLTNDGRFGVSVLSPNSFYRIAYLESKTLSYGSIALESSSSGSETLIPPTLFYSITNELDTDNDGLPDVAEFVIGTLLDNQDTDGDGIKDGTEVRQGTDPLTGLAAQTGIIASVDTPGTAVDVAAFNDIAVVADSDSGISVFNIFNSMNPSIIAQVDTPGNAQAVAFSGNLVALADGLAGLAVVDISDPPNAKITHQISVEGEARAVTTDGSIAYVGTSSGQLAEVDMVSGKVLQQLTISGAIEDVVLNGDYIYALTVGKLHVVPLTSFTEVGSSDSPGSLGAGSRRLRLFAGGGTAYAIHTAGYNTFSLANPIQPTLITAGSTSQFGWKQIVLNGSRLGVAAVSPNSTDDGPHNVSLYDVSDPANTDKFITTFETPGLAAAVYIYNGLAYVADSQAGMQVINYLSYDAKGVPPTITLSTNFAPGRAEEGKTMRLTANTDDDVQVRAVEFYVDGVKVATDGSFPFEYRFITPRRSQQASFTVQAKAIDTGGNATWSDLLTFTLVADGTPPQVKGVTPSAGSSAATGTVSNISATFSESIRPTTLSSTTFKLFSAGPDGIAGNADDVSVTGGKVSYRENDNTALMTFDSPLPSGAYRAVLDSTISDLVGNRLAAEFAWTFRLVGMPDLTPTALTVPEKLVAGQPFETSWTIANQGTDKLQGSWIDSIYLSTDNALDSSDTLLVDVSKSETLAIGANYKTTQEITLSNARPDNYFLIIRTDKDDKVEEGDEKNNTRALAITLLAPDTAPDLTPTSLTASGTFAPGQSVEVSWTIKNQGDDEAVAPWTDSIYLSADTVLDSTDTLLADVVMSETLEFGASYNKTQTVTLPNIPAGNHYLIIQTDKGGQVYETSETNNTRSFAITTVAPDLTPTALSASGSPETEQPLEVSWTVKNQGGFQAQAPWTDSIYLSTDNVLDSADTLLADVSKLEAVAAGGSYSKTQTATLPRVSGGNYYLIIQTDRGGQVYETSETNNTRTYAITVTVSGKAPDLTPTALTPNGTIVAGQVLDVSWTVKNQGTGEARAAWLDGLYLSTDNVLDGSDTLLTQTWKSENVAAGASYTQTQNVLLPGVPAGNYYLIVKADGQDYIYEADEANNARAFPLTITTPDLTPTALTPNGPIIAGQWLDVSWTVKNQGTGEARAAWLDGLYLSTDNVLDGSDTLLTQTWKSENVAAGASYTQTQNVLLPGVPAGSYYLIVKADDQGYIYEADEANNARAFPVTITTPDLTPTALTPNGPIIAGQVLDVSWTVKNQGTGEARAAWLDGLYLSTDNVLDGSDTLLTQTWKSENVAAGASYTQTQNVLLPGVPAGSYYLIVKADDQGYIYEADEANNARAFPVTITTPDLTPTALTPNGPIIAGQVLDVSWTVKNQGTGEARAAWLDGLYLSTDNVLDGSDTLLTQTWKSENVAAGASYTQTQNVLLPGVPAGSYYLIVKADDQGYIYEADETNNDFAVLITITSP
jgi:subtilase family serine protease